MLDIIIPFYKTPKEMLYNCLSSIAMQTAKDDIIVTIVDDGSEREDYKKLKKLVKKFEKFLDIDIIHKRENEGVALARQTGLERTNSDVIMFMDADDCFYTPVAAENICRCFAEAPIQMLITTFVEQGKVRDETHYFFRQGDTTFLHGKAYRRDAINATGAHFIDVPANEDFYFNNYLLLQLPYEAVASVDECTYMWRHNPNSITRSATYEYIYDTGYKYYMENAGRILSELAGKVDQIELDRYCCIMMCRAYKYYWECFNKHLEHLDNCFKHSQKYYLEHFKPYYESNSFDNEILTQEYNNLMMGAYHDNQDFVYEIPKMSFYEFLNRLEGENK